MKTETKENEVTVTVGQRYMYGGRSHTVLSTSGTHIVLEQTKPVFVDNKYGRNIYAKPYCIIQLEQFKRMCESTHPLNPKLIH